MRAPLRILAKSSALLAFVLLFSACGIFSPDKSKDDDGGGTTVEFPLATTRDQLIENFKNSYGERDVSAYEDVLHEDFLFYFSQEDVDALSVPSEWPRAREIEATTAMFEGGSGSGNRTVRSIEIQLDPESSTWDSNVDVRFEGTQRRDYRVDMQVTYENGDIAQVTGIQNFYVRPVEVMVEGSPVTIYQLQFWRDTGQSAG